MKKLKLKKLLIVLVICLPLLGFMYSADVCDECKMYQNIGEGYASFPNGDCYVWGQNCGMSYKCIENETASCIKVFCAWWEPCGPPP